VSYRGRHGLYGWRKAKKRATQIGRYYFIYRRESVLAKLPLAMLDTAPTYVIEAKEYRIKPVSMEVDLTTGAMDYGPSREYWEHLKATRPLLGQLGVPRP
jgi:hypothetical protein